MRKEHLTEQIKNEGDGERERDSTKSQIKNNSQIQRLLQWQLAVPPEISLQILLSGRAPEVLYPFCMGFVLSATSIVFLQKHLFPKIENIKNTDLTL